MPKKIKNCLSLTSKVETDVDLDKSSTFFIQKQNWSQNSLLNDTGYIWKLIKFTLEERKNNCQCIM